MTNLINPIKIQARNFMFCQKMSFVVCKGTHFCNYSILKIKNGLHTKLIALRLVVQKIDFGLDRRLRHEKLNTSSYTYNMYPHIIGPMCRLLVLNSFCPF